MTCDYPDLNKIQELFTKEIDNEGLLDGVKWPSFDMVMFSQVWGDTSLGFDKNVTFAGQALTKEYTVVIWEEHTRLYGVFFGEQLAYLVEKPNEHFFDDLHSHNMASQRGSRRYSL